jgi:AraC family transcriptional regulator, transcriptional activator of the genes for pyochelin and ferripyochelin receptors
MKIRYAATNLTELLDVIGQHTGAVSRRDGVEDLIEFPATVGQGYWRGARLRTGFDLTVHDAEFYEPVRLEGTYTGHRRIGFAFCVSGQIGYQMRGVKQDLTIRPAQSLLALSPATFYGSVDYHPHQRTRYVGVGLEPEVFATLIDGQWDRLPLSLQHVVEGASETVAFLPGALTPAMRVVLTQVFTHPYQGVTKRLYLESKALELVALALASTMQNDAPSYIPPRLRPDDIERIHRAKDVLIDKMDEPPSLLALARQVGLNDFKLKAGFRQVFGTTAFGYLHEQRMERARQLLKERKSNVTEVACTVGYANPSHFASAFKRKFGVNPSAYNANALRMSL